MYQQNHYKTMNESKKSTPIPIEQLSSKEQVFRRSLDAYINAALPHGNISVAMLCIAMGSSSTPLQRRVRQVTGLSVSSYIAYCRVQKAYQMVTTTSHCLTEVSVACGYNSLSYFSKTFHDAFGTMPTDLRQKSQSTNNPEQ